MRLEGFTPVPGGLAQSVLECLGVIRALIALRCQVPAQQPLCQLLILSGLMMFFVVLP